MKKILASVVLSAVWLTSYAQGTVDFSNYGPAAGVNAPVYYSDRITPVSAPQFVAELLGGASASNLFPIATTALLQGSAAGYYVAGGESIPGVPAGYTAWVQVQVWNTASGATFAQAQVSGLPDSWWESSIFSLVTGGGGVTPTLPAPLTGLGNSPVFLNSVPEPSTIDFSVLGAAVALLWQNHRAKATAPRAQGRI